MSRISEEISKTRNRFSLFSKLQKNRDLGPNFWKEAEEMLIQADVGVKTSVSLIAELKDLSKKQKLTSSQDLIECLKENLKKV